MTCITKEGIFEGAHSDLENHDLNPSEYIEITLGSMFQNTINIIVEGRIYQITSESPNFSKFSSDKQ